MPKQCPFLKAAGYINGKESCSEDCALYTKLYNSPHGCAFEVIAMALAATSNNHPLRATIRDE